MRVVEQAEIEDPSDHDIENSITVIERTDREAKQQIGTCL